MKFQVESLVSDAMAIFKDRIITVLCNSPLHSEEVAVVELYTPLASWEGAIKLHDILTFASFQNVSTNDVYVRELSTNALELWLFAPRKKWRGSDEDFDDDPTPVHKRQH